jgi:hypothetical protein
VVVAYQHPYRGAATLRPYLWQRPRQFPVSRKIRGSLPIIISYNEVDQADIPHVNNLACLTGVPPDLAD